MDTDPQHLRDLLRTHQSRLRTLELQAATFGVHAPPHVITEMEQLKAAIADIEVQLGQPTPAVSRAALRQLRQQALAAYYAAIWERAEELLVQVVHADPADQDACIKLEHTQHQLDLYAFYQAICDLRKDGNRRAVLAALDDLEQHEPDYPGTRELRRWAEDQRTPTTLPRPKPVGSPPRRRNLRQWLEDTGTFAKPPDHLRPLLLIAAMGLALLLIVSNGNRWPAYQLMTSFTATPGPTLFRVVNTGGTGLSVRSAPDAMRRPIKTLPDSTIVTIIGPDSVEPDMTWKHIRDPDGAEGWVMSNWVQPVP